MIPMFKRILFSLALTLCMGVFLFPATVYAAGNSAPPTLRAWINGELLHVEVTGGQSGVETVFIGAARVNYRVDGAFSVLLRDVAGTGEHISIYAVDFAGQRSNIVILANPFYVPPTPAPAAPTPTQPAAQRPPSTPQTTAPTANSNPPAEPSSQMSSEPRPFTPDGTGTVMDNVIEQNSKEFFTISTPDNNVFYLIIDRDRGSENVYLLGAVTEHDLLSLAQSGGGPGQSAVPTPEPLPPQTQPEPAPESEPEQPMPNRGGNGGAILIILLAALGIGGAGYYLKVIKPRRQADLDDDYEDEEDESDYEEPDRVYDDYDSEEPAEEAEEDEQ